MEQTKPTDGGIDNELGAREAMLWCIAFLMAGRSRLEPDPKEHLANVFASAREIPATLAAHARNSTPSGPEQQAQPDILRAWQRTLDQIETGALAFSLAWSPPSAAPTRE